MQFSIKIYKDVDAGLEKYTVSVSLNLPTVRDFRKFEEVRVNSISLYDGHSSIFCTAALAGEDFV